MTPEQSTSLKELCQSRLSDISYPESPVIQPIAQDIVEVQSIQNVELRDNREVEHLQVQESTQQKRNRSHKQVIGEQRKFIENYISVNEKLVAKA